MKADVDSLSLGSDLLANWTVDKKPAYFHDKKKYFMEEDFAHCI